MKPLDSKKDYQNYVDKKSPNSPIWKNCFNAFWVGGNLFNWSNNYEYM